MLSDAPHPPTCVGNTVPVTGKVVHVVVVAVAPELRELIVTEKLG